MLLAFSSRVKLFVFYLHGAAALIVWHRTHSTSSWRYTSNVLAKHGRPQRDTSMALGRGAPRSSAYSLYVSSSQLNHPGDASDGKPRGHKEMVHNINFTGVRKGDIFVSDKWRATVSAMKCLRKDKSFTEQQLRHEIVNNSIGEIANQNGFSTNAIEWKWSVIKRGIKQKMSGTLATHSNRPKWPS